MLVVNMEGFLSEAPTHKYIPPSLFMHFFLHIFEAGSGKKHVIGFEPRRSLKTRRRHMSAIEVLVLCDVLLFNALFSLFTLQSFFNKVWMKTMPASRVVRFFFQIINVIHTTFIRTSGLELLDLRSKLHILQCVKCGAKKFGREIAICKNYLVES